MKNPEKFPELATERLVLRKITEDDVGWYFHHFRLPEIAVTTGFDGPADLDAAKDELERYIIAPFRESTGLRWGITMKGSRELIGSCGFYKWEHDPHRRAEIGYDLHPTYWRQGIMTEALTAIIDYGFDEMDLNRITLLAFSYNEPSVSLARSLGFVREGILRENSYYGGRFHDDEYFALLRSDWKRSRTPSSE